MSDAVSLNLMSDAVSPNLMSDAVSPNLMSDAVSPNLMSDAVPLTQYMLAPYERLQPDNFNVLPQLSRCPPLLDLHLEKVSIPRILTVLANFKTPLNLTPTNS